MFSFRLTARHRAWGRAATFVILAGGFASCGSLFAASPQHKDRALEDALDQDLKNFLSTRSSIEHISTLSMTVTFRGDPKPINLVVGTTQYGGGQPVTPSNLFQIGSDTKSFTSTLILQLEAAGALSIEDTLGKWLPQYPAWETVTIHQLLNMTSGIPTYDNTPAWAADYSEDPYIKSTLADLVGYVYPNINQPGHYEYSNTGYILLEMIIKKASWWHDYKGELDELIAENNLHETFYEPYFYPAAVARRLVSGYEVNTDDQSLEKLWGMDTSGFSLGWTQADGGILSTPQDVAKWVRALFEGEVLPPKQKKELMSLVAIPGGEPIRVTSAKNPQGFGLGVSQVTTPAEGLFWAYEGSTIGYRAVYTYFPGSGLIICVFTNSQTSAATSTVVSGLVPTLYQTLKSFGKN
jgi:D-alanyl-D-alanine carboxypeptidase